MTHCPQCGTPKVEPVYDLTTYDTIVFYTCPHCTLSNGKNLCIIPYNLYIKIETHENPMKQHQLVQGWSRNSLQQIFLNELLCEPRLLKGDGKFGNDNIYMQVINTVYRMEEGDFYVQEAGAKGGVWWTIGEGYVHEDRVTLKLKTINGIITSRNEHEKITFQSCVPGFPDNIMFFLEKAVLNAKKARNLQSRRARRHRTILR